MEAPQHPAVEEAVCPVADQIAEHEDLGDLRPAWLPTHQPSRLVRPGFEVGAVERHACGEGQQQDGRDYGGRLPAVYP
jgi:hypothetical protein